MDQGYWGLDGSGDTRFIGIYFIIWVFCDELKESYRLMVCI